MIQPVLGLKIGLIQHILFDRTRKPANRQRAQPIQRQGVIQMIEAMQQNVSRRNFIKGVIATGAAVSSAAYVFRGGALLGQQGLVRVTGYSAN